MNKKDLALNHPQGLMCHKTKPNLVWSEYLFKIIALHCLQIISVQSEQIKSELLKHLVQFTWEKNW